ncbi:MAG: CDGSH iron-sulfur domain-containing protein [Candidatus Binatia bacterium]
MSAVRIRALKDGPYQVVGSVDLVVGPEDVARATEGDTYLCRCGHSATKPFCDGTHKKIDFRAEGWARPSSRG